MRPAREAVMTALYDTLVASVVTSFTADTEAKSQALSSPSTTNGLFLGLPVFGAGIPRGAVITALSPLTISIPATANAIGVPMATGFATTDRRVKFVRDVPLPAMFLRAADEELEFQGMQQLQTIKAEVWLGTDAGEDPDVVPETALNNLLDAIQGALAPDDYQRGVFTLGGLVSWCRMSGKVEKDTGDLGDLAIAVADIEIFVP